MRRWIVLLAGATFLLHCVSTSATSQVVTNAADLRGRVQVWRDWSKKFGDYTVTVDTGKTESGKRIVNLRTIQRRTNGHRCIRLKYSEGNGLTNVAIVQNPAYSAKLAMGLNDEWVLTGLTLRQGPDYEKMLDELSIVGADYFDRKIVNTGAKVIPLMLDEAGYSVTTVEEIGDAIAYTAVFTKGYHADPPKYSMIRLHFAKSGLAPPLQLDFTFPERKFSRIFRDWTKADGKDVPTKDLQYSPEFFSSGIEPIDTGTFDYANFDAPFDTATCYLSHYGLPEPSGVANANLSLWILGVAGVALMVIGFVVRRNRLFAN